ncbi:MAG: HlyD family efflux transporter periplasmic adaptor subunit [Caulobacter sp.]|nr:HlyD family efflux transporter periplasmic adaptor subunit [Caulobacter sp.]
MALLGAAAAVLTAAVAIGAHRGGQARDAATAAAGEQSAVIQGRPFVSTIAVAGSIAPGPGGELLAPFEGVVRSVGFAYGEPVTAGQVLLVFDTAEVEARRNDAEASMLKASQAARDMADWNNGPEMSRARQAVASSEADLVDSQRKLAETKGLLDRGLVPRTEFETAQRQLLTQEAGLAAARRDLAVVEARGRGANRRVAELELSNARARLASFSGQAAGAVLRAPVSGVMVRPPADKGEPVAVHAGSPMTRGQLIGVIASADALSVTFKLGEVDANQVKVGQAVTVTGAGFPGLVLRGRVASVAGEALPPSAGSPTSTVAATARLEGLAPEEAAQVRIGMSANVSIEVYSNPTAVVAPPAAIQGAAPAATVTVRDPRTGKTRSVAVRLGRVAPDGVEVLSGLKAGDTVVWTPPSMPPAPV